MATGGIAATRENLFYIGWAKESAWGTPVAPSGIQFWRWLDGTDANPERKVTKEREGDTSPLISFIYATEQHWGIKVKEYARPVTMGCALQSILGTGSDTYTAPTQSTTLAASITAGATTFQSTASLGTVGTLVMAFTPAGTSYEVQTVNLASHTGAGPYTYTLAAAATFKNNHANSDPILSAATHAFTRQLTTYDPYTIEAAFSQASFGQAFRIQDCVNYQCKITMETGKPLVLEHDWYGSLATEQAALLTPSFEGTSVVGNPGSPFMFYQNAGTFLVDSLGTGAAAVIKKLELTLKNTTTAEDFQTEGFQPTYFIPGNMDIDGTMEVIFTSYRQYLETYFNATSNSSSNTDSYITGYGQASATFNTDALNSFALSLPNIAYTAAKLNPPKLDGKALMQAITFSAQKTAAVTVPLTLTLTNTQTSAY